MSFIGEWRLASFLSTAGKQLLQTCENNTAIFPTRMLSGMTKASVQKGLNQTYDPYQESLMQEECILVDENDKATGQASKRVCHTIDPKTGTSPLHRAFSLFIFNSENKLLLQQRSDTKITFPNLWTNSCCSHPLATFDNEQNAPGESDGLGVKLAAQRKSLDELGIPPDQLPVEKMMYLTRILYKSSSCDKWAEHELDYILFFKDYSNDIIPQPNPDEIQDIRYVGKDELEIFLQEQKMKNCRFNGITPWFNLIATSMLPNWWENIDNLESLKDHTKIMKFE